MIFPHFFEFYTDYSSTARLYHMENSAGEIIDSLKTVITMSYLLGKKAGEQRAAKIHYYGERRDYGWIFIRYIIGELSTQICVLELKNHRWRASTGESADTFTELINSMFCEEISAQIIRSLVDRNITYFFESLKTEPQAFGTPPTNDL